MNDFDKDLGKRIWQLRQERGLTREKLSELADISSKFLYEIENGRKGISAKVLYKLALSLKTDCNSLVYGNLDKNEFSYIENLLSTLNEMQLKNAEKVLFYFCDACKK